jgi:S-formylglutathione hydrolase FrmB
MSERRLPPATLAPWLLVALSCTLPSARGDAPPTGSVVEVTVPGPALAGNLLGETGRRAVNVYLPPSYARDPARRYPAVYLLHGYQGSHAQWMAGGKEWNIRDVMDRLIAQGKVGEMIVVMPDARNKFGGSFYTNSATTGNWEDFLVTDLVAAIDGRYRTLARPASRGIAGHSMGGYGAIKLAMKFPHRFGAVYAHSPACLAWGGDLTPESPAWDTTLSFRDWKDLQPNGKDYLAQAFLALSAAWSPNPARPPFFADLPVATKGPLRRREEVIARWSANMPVAMVDQYRSNLARLRGIGFDVGTRDEFPHIPLGARALAAALRRNGIRHTYEEYEGDHNNRVPHRIEVKLLPFFSRTLAFEK